VPSIQSAMKCYLEIIEEHFLREARSEILISITYGNATGTAWVLNWLTTLAMARHSEQNYELLCYWNNPPSLDVACRIISKVAAREGVILSL